MPYYNVDQHIVFVDCLQFLKVYDDKHKLCENKENKKNISEGKIIFYQI